MSHENFAYQWLIQDMQETCIPSYKITKHMTLTEIEEIFIPSSKTESCYRVVKHISETKIPVKLLYDRKNKIWNY